MRPNEHPGLLKLIRNEIDLGFTFMETHRVASSPDHAAHARENAKAALGTANRLLKKLSEEHANAFKADLQRLERLIASNAWG